MLGFHPEIEIHWLDKATPGEIASAARWCEWLRADESNSIGFIPNATATYRRAAELGRLCLALASDFILPIGFCYYGIRNKTLRIQQIAIYRTFRRRGIGRNMIGHLMARHDGEIERIALKCRDGLPAVAFWKALGFIPGEARAKIGARGQPVREYMLDGYYSIEIPSTPTAPQRKPNNDDDPPLS